jgi:hypothetical protein
LAVRVRAHVDRHAIHAGQKVGAVVEIEAAQVILICFARAAMLSDDDAGNGLDDFAGAQEWPQRDLGVANGAFIRGVGNIEQAVGAVGDLNSIEPKHEGGLLG